MGNLIENLMNLAERAGIEDVRDLTPAEIFAKAAAMSGAAADFLFGDGSDGSLAYDTADSRWEDGAGGEIKPGHPLVDSGKVSVSGATLTVKLPLKLKNLTIPSGATVVVGEHSSGAMRFPHILIGNTLYVGGTLRAEYWPISPAGGGSAARRIAAGAGAPASATYRFALSPTGGGGGAGGGVGSYNGGNGLQAYTTNGLVWPLQHEWYNAIGGGPNAGASASSLPNPATSFGYWNAPRIPGRYGWGAGGGALAVTETGAYGGAGGAPGRAGGVLDIRAWKIAIASGGVIRADGETGGNGENGSSVSSGNRAGGGGGGGGGAGGAVAIGYGPGGYSNSGTVSANGGLGGTGGAGEKDDHQPEPGSNGGNGSAGQNGFVAIERIL